MASFQAKIGWIRQIKRENKNCRSVPFRSYTTCDRKFQKIAKKFKKSKKCNSGFFSSQNRLGRPRKRENKNYRSDPFLTDPKLKIPKK